MPRPNLRRRVRMMWKADRVGLGAKVVVWIPKALRGKSGVVVATDDQARKGVKKAPWDKYRVQVRTASGTDYCVCALDEMLPKGKTEKDVVG